MTASKPTLGELVTIRSRRGLSLQGLLYRGHSSRTIIIHIHGSFGNFYANSFVPTMARIYTKAGAGFLSINTSCHDGIAEGDRRGNLEYVGGGCADFNECLADIEAAIAFARRFCDRVVLQGHSLGCDRVIHYLTNTRAKHDFVLLSPCD